MSQRSTEDNLFNPIHSASKKTAEAEKKYSSYELEIFAIIKASKELRIYFLGRHFKIITDCSAFQRTIGKKNSVTRIARWALLLEEFDYATEHRSGTQMGLVDVINPRLHSP